MTNRRYVYGCDGGSIMIGNASSRVCITNGYGDGSHYVYVRGLNHPQRYGPEGYRFVGTIQGDNVNVYDYDCLSESELEKPQHILCKLEKGRYAIYVSDGTIILQQWD